MSRQSQPEKQAKAVAFARSEAGLVARIALATFCSLGAMLILAALSITG